MPTFGVVVEGHYDREALTELICKIIGGQPDIQSRICGSRSSLMKQFPAFLEEFRYVRHGLGIDKAIIIRDADNKDPQALIQEMREKIRDRSYPFPVNFVIIVQELEAWLLADEIAISAVTGKTVPRVNETLEDIYDPKSRLKQILIRCGVTYTSRVAGQIAAATQLQTIHYRCPRFGSFHQAVLDC